MSREKLTSNSIFLKIGLLIFLAIVMLSASHVKADNTISVENNFKKTVVYSKDDEKYGYIFSMSGLYGDSLKQVKIKSSNKSVAIIKPISGGAFQLHPRKAGTTHITITAFMNNKKVKKTGTVKVVNFQNPFKNLKVGGKNYFSKIKGSYNYLVIPTKKPKIKLNYKLNATWKIVDSNAYGTKQLSNMGRSEAKNKMSYSIENGETLMILLKLKNKKNGAEVVTWLHIMR